MKLSSLIVSVFVLLVSIAHAAQKSEYHEFFNKYQSLGHNFDVSVANLYSDDAQIIAVRKMPDGIEQTLKVDGKKWKQMINDSMEIGKQRGDKSEFSDIKIVVDKNKAKITASRYSTLKCFKDTSYYMIVSKKTNGNLQIIEEFMESPVLSKCKNTAKNDLALVLQGAVKMTNKQLPVMVDSDTKLERTSSEGAMLIYHFELVNYLSTEIDAQVLEQSLKPLVIQQTCTMPNLTPVVNQGGTVSYRYNGKDKKQILVINIDKNSCK
jgi:hypothetical protein